MNFNDGNTINIFTDASTTTYNGETYVSIMRNNLDLIKKELYQ